CRPPAAQPGADGEGRSEPTGLCAVEPAADGERPACRLLSASGGPPGTDRLPRPGRAPLPPHLRNRALRAGYGGRPLPPRPVDGTGLLQPLLRAGGLSGDAASLPGGPDGAAGTTGHAAEVAVQRGDRGWF